MAKIKKKRAKKKKDFSEAAKCRNIKLAEEAFKILEQSRVGSNKIYETLERDNKQISYYQINKVFQKYIDPERVGTQRNSVRMCRYVMDKVGACWYGEIQYVFLSSKHYKKKEIQYFPTGKFSKI